MENLLDHVDLIMEIMDISTNINQMFCVVTPMNKEDVLVLRGLSLLLLRLSRGSLPNNCYRLDSLEYSFIDSLKQMGKVVGKVSRVYKVDLQLSLRTLPICIVEEKILQLVGEDSIVYRLLSSFLRLPIIDEMGQNWKNMIYLSGIPSVGEITKVLLHIILRETFDPEFPKWYPGIPFLGFHNEVFLFQTLQVNDDQVLLDEKALFLLMKELCLFGKIESIGPCEKPLTSSCSEKLLFVDSDSNVELCDYKDSH